MENEMTPLPRELTGYLAPDGFLPELTREVGDGVLRLGRLVLCPGPAVDAAWAQNVWHSPRVIAFESIAQAANALKGLGRRWALYDEHLRNRGRAKLIQERLSGPSPKSFRFGTTTPNSPLGSWTLLDDRTLLASARCSSPFAHGDIQFLEDKTGPPSRAYLKLWEVFTLLGQSPKPGQLCLDLGSSPGGWTWVLQKLGARVISVDKAPLAPGLANLEGVDFRVESAFAQRPEKIGPVDWLFSDVICYPHRLLSLVTQWLEAGAAKNYVCTIKFQGETDFETIDRFRAIPNSRLLHLAHNKHELTWVWGKG
ncbi:SAM-dependent methyltransferase [Desulfonatronum thiosulfatophilum]|uniref:SAM-dependent methyltransferase n=1 Tax=Desulfonatronum thiosulfatophilum TaxID=617002 RepID=UPI003CC6C8B7